MNLVKRIKQLCIQQHISLHRLEMEVGFSKSSISKWDVHVPSVDKVLTIADYFDVSMDFLLGRAHLANENGALFPVNYNSDYFASLTDAEKDQLLQYLAFLRSKNVL